jgi:hypothetical protein
MPKLENLIKFEVLHHKFERLVFCSLISLSPFLFDGCKKGEDITGIKESPLKVESAKIVDSYKSWSNKLISQDYSGATSYCVPGSDGAGRTNVHKARWDRGEQSYDDITYVEAWLDEEGLSRGYGEAVGNTTYYQRASFGSVEYNWGFYSSARKINGRWKIDGFNSKYDPNWWKK